MRQHFLSIFPPFQFIFSFVVVFVCFKWRVCPSTYPEFFKTVLHTTLWSCSEPGSLWEMPDSNPGPLPRDWWVTNKPPHLLASWIQQYYILPGPFYPGCDTIWTASSIHMNSVVSTRVAMCPMRSFPDSVVLVAIRPDTTNLYPIC